MGLSIVISGAIILTTLMMILFTLPGLMDKLTLVEDASSQISNLENLMSQTDIEITSTQVSSGSDIVSFELFNKGDEKLWNWDEFNLFITYDADIGGTKTRVTEEFTYNDVGLTLTPDFNIQRGAFAFGASEDADSVTITPVKSIGEGGNAFLRITNVLSTSGGPDPPGVNGQRNNDDLGVRAELTSTDTITFTRLALGFNEDILVTWEVWEYVGLPGGPNEFIVRLDQEVTTTGPTAVDTIIPNVVNRNNLVPFIAGITNSGTGASSDDANHTTEIIDIGAGNTAVRILRNGIGSTSLVSLVVLEFTGSNWKIQNNVSHLSFAASGSNEVENITPVNSWSEAFIVPSKRNPVGEFGLDDTGYNVWPHPVNDNQIHFRLRSGADVPASHAIIAHVIENPGMVVQHVDSITGGGVDFPNVPLDGHTENRGITAVSSLAESGLIATVDCAGGGTAYGRPHWNYQYTADDNVEFYRGRGGQPGEWALQAIEFPRYNNPISTNLWSVIGISGDFSEPGILNSQETAHISAQLSNPIFSNGVLQIQISSDRGIVASNSQLVS